MSLSAPGDLTLWVVLLSPPREPHWSTTMGSPSILTARWLAWWTLPPPPATRTTMASESSLLAESTSQLLLPRLYCPVSTLALMEASERDGPQNNRRVAG